MGSIEAEARAHPLFVDLPAAELSRVLARVRIIHHEAGEIVYGSGSPADAVSVLLSGALQIEYPVEGETRGPVTALIVAPAVVGESQVLAGRPWTGTGVAITPLTALGFDKATWLGLLTDSPTITARLYLELAGRFLLAIETWRNQPVLSPPGLLARYCLGVAIARARTGLSASDELPIDQKALALATGLTRETVNRALKSWAEEGLVRVKRGLLCLDQPEALRALAGPGFEFFLKSYWAVDAALGG